jgi:hypothetical protein
MIKKNLNPRKTMVSLIKTMKMKINRNSPQKNKLNRMSLMLKPKLKKKR